MKEFKIKYPHKNAKEILKNIGAKFIEKTIQEDFYLKSDEKRILKLQKEGNNIYFMELTKEKEGFGISISERLDKEATKNLIEFFENNPLVMKKIREHYFWKGTRIVLDNVIGLGEFIEIYPTEELLKEKLFDFFNVGPSDLITKSYYDMWKK